MANLRSRSREYEIVDRQVAQRFAGLNAVGIDDRIFLDCAPVPIFCCVQLTQCFIALSDPLSEITPVERLISVGHEEVNLQRILVVPAFNVPLSAQLKL